ncbi:methyltransferase family protein [Sediminihabitans luteus]|uniref:Methyltransferase family protein n=1 Tax=Sediminihabitans luteus TaxID=1138585 RepID=A0A2M9CCK3_9CELL|nr:methyltransferase [Sediminihabitans luteus]PJJ69053.1 methyltransferase family protein [Sediminihabitans luteus]GII99439.1 16S RNA G1207 methylase RsmC [Sediminihabitans luteus]
MDETEARNDHYFTAEPASAAERREIDVRLDGDDVRVEVASGIFSPGRLDLGTQVLLRSVPAPPSGSRADGAAREVLDLGCGWGPVALTLARRAPEARVWAVDVNERSLDLTRRNAARLGADGVRAVRPEDVPGDVRFDTIWSNPPIRVGKDVLHDMLRHWLPRLMPDGAAYLVVQRNLGADSLARWMNENLDGLATAKLASAKGFRVLEVVPTR